MMHQQPQTSSSSNTFLRRMDDIEHVLRERVALLPGARDRENRPIIFIPARNICTNTDHIRNLMIYLYDVTSVLMLHNPDLLAVMRELLKSEKDYIEDLRKCFEIYLYAYKTAGSTCPLELRGKEREIFGNIEEFYQFHSSIFIGELFTYELNPEDVGYCFITWMDKLKELYADYCLNKEENTYLICLPEAVSMFTQIREQHALEPCHDLQSLVIKPVQRITKYHILLKELLKYSTKKTKEMKNAYQIVVSIPKLANDRIHLKSFENYQEFNVGDFVMQDSFQVSEPKRYFKRERELQVFLFESNIVFAKKEELGTKKTGYVYKDSILLCEIHIVEHIEADNTKFGLRKSAVPYQNDHNTTVLKANMESQRILWMKTMRDLKMDIGRQKTSIESSSSGNRASRDSQSSLILQSVAGQVLEDGSSMQSAADSFTGQVTMREGQLEYLNISQQIQTKTLHMVSDTDPNKSVEETIVMAARQLQALEQEVMNIAKDISNRIELNIQLGRLRQLAHEVVEAIEREQMRLLQFYHIPGNQQETDLEFKYFNEFRMEIETPMQKAETRVRVENLLTEVKSKWQYLVGLIDTRNKLLTAANSYYKYTKLLLPTSQSIEKGLSADKDGDFCKSGNGNSLEQFKNDVRNIQITRDDSWRQVFMPKRRKMNPPRRLWNQCVNYSNPRRTLKRTTQNLDCAKVQLHTKISLLSASSHRLTSPDPHPTSNRYFVFPDLFFFCHTIGIIPHNIRG